MKRFSIPLLVLVVLCLILQIKGSPAIAQNNVYIAFGDSITRGCCFPDVEPYPTILEELLNKTVINKGENSKDSQWGADNIQSVLDANPNATHVLIQFGTNDARFSVSIGTFRDNMRSIIREVEEAGMRPLLAKAPILYSSEMRDEPCQPSTENAREYNLKLRRYNYIIDEITKDYNLEVAPGRPFVPPDFYSYFLTTPTSTVDFKSIEFSDCWHPNNTGYASMARIWAEVLQESDTISEPHTQFFKYKGEIERISNNGTFQPDDHLFIDIGANETWSFEVVLWVKTTDRIGDFKFLWRGPDGSDVRSNVIAYENKVIVKQSNLLGMKTVVNIDYNNPVTIQPIYIKGLFSTRSKAGRIRLEWCQREASGTTSVYFPSYLEARRVMEKPIYP